MIVTTSFGPAALAGEPDTTSTAPPTSTAAGDADRIDEIEAQIQALFDELRKLRDDCPNNDTGDDKAAQAPDPDGAKSFPRGSKPDSEAAEDKADPKPEDAEDDKAAEPAAPSDGTKCAPTPPGPGSSGDAQPDGKATTKPDTGDDKKADPKQPGDAKTEPAAATAADTVVLPADGAPTDPGDKRVQSPNPSPVADADTLTGPKIRISKDDDPEAALNGKTLAAGTVVEIERGAVFEDVRVTVSGEGTPQVRADPSHALTRLPIQILRRRPTRQLSTATMEASTLDWTSMYDNIEDIGDGRDSVVGVRRFVRDPGPTGKPVVVRGES